MSFWTTLEQQRLRFANALNTLRALKAGGNIPGNRLDGLIAAARSIHTMLNTLNDEGRTDTKTITDTHKQLQGAIKAYTAAIRNVRPDTHPSAEENRAVWELVTVAGDYTNQTLKPLLHTMDTLNVSMDRLPAVDMDRALAAGSLRALFSGAENDIPSPTAVADAGQLLWFGESISLADRLGQFDWNFRASAPYQSYMNLLHRIENDTPAAQMRCALLLANRERQLTQRITETYRMLTARYANEKNSSRKVMEALVIDDNYRAARSFFALKDRLMHTFLAQPLQMATKRLVPPELGMGIDVPALLDGRVEAYLGRSKAGSEALRSADEVDQQRFNRTGLPVNDFTRQLLPLLRQFARDKDRSASPFYAIANRLIQLAREDPTGTNDLTFQKRLRACYFAAQSYVKTHNPYSDDGKARLALAKRVAALTKQKLEERMPQNAVIEADNISNTSLDADDIARLMVNAGTVQLDTALPARRHEVSSLRKNEMLRGFGHKLYTGLVTLAQNTTAQPTSIVGSVMAARRRARGPSEAERNGRRYDSEHVPGLQEDRYREPEGNNIITDKRRIPLVWERPIPEDPEQPITLTVSVDQPFEGSDVGTDWRSDKVGHAFLTLQYTKVNPLTGRRQRYQTCFGFYPKYDDPLLHYAGATTGFTMPGTIQSDFTHDAAVGATVTITPQQFNDIVRFTGEYERGGYNMATRNCARFVMDAVKHAGVVVPELEGVKEVDLSNRGISLGPSIAFGNLAAGNTLVNEMATRRIIEEANRENISQYSRIGQSEASLDDIERCRHTQLNMRLKGYAPGEMAETIRGNAGICLHSRKYRGTKENRRAAWESFLNDCNETMKQDFEGSGITAETIAADIRKETKLNLSDRTPFYLNLLDLEFPRLRSQIEKVYGRDNDALNTLLEKMDTLHRTAYDAIKSASQDGFSFSTADTREESIRNITAGTNAINSYIADLNSIFQNQFQSDPRVNIPFHNMVSLAEQLRFVFYEHYRQSQEMTRSINLTFGQALTDKRRESLQRMEQQLYDPSRDASHAIWTANHVKLPLAVPNAKSGFTAINMRPTELLATMLAFRDPMAAMQKFVVNNKDNLSDLYAMGHLRADMMRAAETFQDGHEYSDAELDVVFNRLPDFETKVQGSFCPPSACYQTMALSAILGDGFLSDANGTMNEKFMKLLNDKGAEVRPSVSSQELFDRDLQNGFKLRKYEKKSQEEIAALPDEQKADYANALAEKEAVARLREEAETKAENLKTLINEFTDDARSLLEQRLHELPPKKKEKLDNVVKIMADSLIRTRGAATAEQKRDCVMEAREKLGAALANGYLKNICDKAINQAAVTPQVNTILSRAFTLQQKAPGNPAASRWIPSLYRRPAPAANHRSRSIHQSAPDASVQNRPRSKSFGGK